MTQRDAAAQVGRAVGQSFCHTYLSKIENDHEIASRAVLLACADLYGADSDELLALAGKPPEDVAGLLVSSPEARAFYRRAVEMGLTEAQWRRLTEALCRIGGD